MKTTDITKLAAILLTLNACGPAEDHPHVGTGTVVEVDAGFDALVTVSPEASVPEATVEAASPEATITPEASSPDADAASPDAGITWYPADMKFEVEPVGKWVCTSPGITVTVACTISEDDAVCGTALCHFKAGVVKGAGEVVPASDTPKQ
jgi:hypothetical protein